MNSSFLRWLPPLLLAHACAHGSPGRPRDEPSEQGARSNTVRSGSLGRQALREQVLAAHNAHRARHCAPALQWSEPLRKEAQAWAQRLARRGCPLEHSQTSHGQNLAAGTRGGFTPGDFVDLWYREVEKYRFARGKFSMSTGHFTQLVWRATRRVGCALSACDNGLELLVCNYDPPGNVDTLFAENVLPASCKR
jgi:uncharacterized protein YkwD